MRVYVCFLHLLCIAASKRVIQSSYECTDCKDEILEVFQSNSAIISCNAERGCSGALVSSDQAGNITLLCTAPRSCQDLSVIALRASVYIVCSAERACAGKLVVNAATVSVDCITTECLDDTASFVWSQTVNLRCTAEGCPHLHKAQFHPTCDKQHCVCEDTMTHSNFGSMYCSMMSPTSPVTTMEASSTHSKWQTAQQGSWPYRNSDVHKAYKDQPTCTYDACTSTCKGDPSVARLMVPVSTAENSFLLTDVVGPTKMTAWIGIRKQAGRWRNGDGDLIKYENWAVVQGGADCAVMNPSNGEWVTRDCQVAAVQVCENDLGLCGANTITPSSVAGLTWGTKCADVEDGKECVTGCDAYPQLLVRSKCTYPKWGVPIGDCSAPPPCTGQPTTVTGITWNCATTPSSVVCQQACSSGYSGTVESMCSSGIWKSPQGTCKPRDCTGNPAVIVGVTWDCSSRRNHGQICNATCTPPATGGPPSSRCDLGKWDIPKNRCTLPSTVTCTGTPKKVPGITWNCSTSNTNGDVCQIPCAVGYTSGSVRSECTTAAIWKDPVGTCTPATCTGAPTAVTGVQWDAGCATRSTCTGLCTPGYKGGPLTATCTAGAWAPPIGDCAVEVCNGLPPTIVGGSPWTCNNATTCSTTCVATPGIKVFTTCKDSKWPVVQGTPCGTSSPTPSSPPPSPPPPPAPPTPPPAPPTLGKCGGEPGAIEGIVWNCTSQDMNGIGTTCTAPCGGGYSGGTVATQCTSSGWLPATGKCSPASPTGITPSSGSSTNVTIPQLGYTYQLYHHNPQLPYNHDGGREFCATQGAEVARPKSNSEWADVSEVLAAVPDIQNTQLFIDLSQVVMGGSKQTGTPTPTIPQQSPPQPPTVPSPSPTAAPSSLLCNTISVNNNILQPSPTSPCPTSWAGSGVICQVSRPTCPTPTTPAHTKTTISNTTPTTTNMAPLPTGYHDVGTTLTINCISPYILLDPSSSFITCVRHNTWSSDLSPCVAPRISSAVVTNSHQAPTGLSSFTGLTAGLISGSANPSTLLGITSSLPILDHCELNGKVATSKNKLSFFLTPFYFINVGNNDVNVIVTTFVVILGLSLLHVVAVVGFSRLKNVSFATAQGWLKSPNFTYVLLLVTYQGVCFSGFDLLLNSSNAGHKVLGGITCCSTLIYPTIIALYIIPSILLPNTTSRTFNTTPLYNQRVGDQFKPSMRWATVVLPSWYWYSPDKPSLVLSHSLLIAGTHYSRYSMYSEPIHLLSQWLTGCLGVSQPDCKHLGYVLLAIGILRIITLLAWRPMRSFIQCALLILIQVTVVVEVVLLGILRLKSDMVYVAMTIITTLFIGLYVLHVLVDVLFEMKNVAKLEKVETQWIEGNLEDGMLAPADEQPDMEEMDADYTWSVGDEEPGAFTSGYSQPVY